MDVDPTDPVEKLVGGPAVTVPIEAPLAEVARALVDDRIGAVGVMGASGFVGVLSERDVVTAVVEDADLEGERAGDWMSVAPLTIGSDESIATAAEVMLDGGVRHLPVVVGDVLVGFVSIRDVLAVFAHRR